MSVLVEGSEVELVPPQLVRELLRARGWGAAPHSRLGTDREIVRLWRLAGRDGSGNRNIVVIIIIVIYYHDYYYDDYYYDLRRRDDEAVLE